MPIDEQNHSPQIFDAHVVMWREGSKIRNRSLDSRVEADELITTLAMLGFTAVVMGAQLGLHR